VYVFESVDLGLWSLLTSLGRADLPYSELPTILWREEYGDYMQDANYNQAHELSLQTVAVYS
jgi:hypothetical protein